MTTEDEMRTLRWRIGYRWWRFRVFLVWVKWTPRRVCWWVAFHLPVRVAYYAFIRVHGLSEVHWTFEQVAKTWVARHRIEGE